MSIFNQILQTAEAHRQIVDEAQEARLQDKKAEMMLLVNRFDNGRIKYAQNIELAHINYQGLILAVRSAITAEGGYTISTLAEKTRVRPDLIQTISERKQPPLSVSQAQRLYRVLGVSILTQEAIDKFKL